MKNNPYTIFQILTICLSIIYCENSTTEYELFQKTQIIQNGINKEENLKIYSQQFEQNKNKYENLKKIKEILIEKKEFSELIAYYEKYINHILDTKHKFEIEVELLEIKIWGQDENWINDLYILENKYLKKLKNQTKNEYILHKLFKNKKIDEGYNFVLFIRKKYDIPYFFSKKLI